MKLKEKFTLTYDLYQLILPTDEDSSIDKENNIIFSQNTICKNIEETKNLAYKFVEILENYKEKALPYLYLLLVI